MQLGVQTKMKYHFKEFTRKDETKVSLKKESKNRLWPLKEMAKEKRTPGAVTNKNAMFFEQNIYYLSKVENRRKK